jgi:DNA-binding transcriptional MerR regulator
MYYRVGDIAKKIGVSSQTIRVWSEKFSIFKPIFVKTQRRYSEKDLENFRTVKTFYDIGYKQEAINKKLKNMDIDEIDDKTFTINTLQSLKIFLLNLKNNL